MSLLKEYMFSFFSEVLQMFARIRFHKLNSLQSSTRRHPRMLPTGSANTALLPEILGDVNNAGGGGAPIERESGGGMGHFMAIENTEKKRQRKRKIHTRRK